jgi:hypothetical protein
MSSPELIILTVTGVIAMLTYVVKHMKTSTCWTSESCFNIKMDNTKSPTSSVSDIKVDIKVDEKVNDKIVVSSVV